MTVAADRFSVAVGPASGTGPVQEVGQFDSLGITMNIDDGCTVDFDLRGGSPSGLVIDELATDVWVYKDGAILQRFRVISADQSWGESGEDEVSVSGVCYKRLMNARMIQTGLTYTSTGQADIVWGLIQHTQAQVGGDFGITAGTLNSGGYNRDRSYVPGDNLGQMLHNLQEVINGPWWEISGDLELNVSLYDVFPVRTTPIVLGATARTLARTSGAQHFANAVFVDGDSGFTTPVTATSPTLAADPRGRWERAEGFPTVVLQDTLQEKADGLVTSSLSPVAAWSADVEPRRYLSDADFAPGDFVEVVVPPSVTAPIGTPAYSVGAQLMNVSLGLDASGEVTVAMELIEVPE